MPRLRKDLLVSTFLRLQGQGEDKACFPQTVFLSYDETQLHTARKRSGTEQGFGRASLHSPCGRQAAPELPPPR